jgi:hypothetical protein
MLSSSISANRMALRRSPQRARDGWTSGLLRRYAPRNDARRGRINMRRLAFSIVVAAFAASAAHAETVLDYDFFKRKVEPIFLKKRGDHARCAVCHQQGNSAFRLEKLTERASSWSEEQSKKNFAVVSTLVVPGDPAQSRLLLQPLAPQAGGNAYHSGGWQFASKSDADWKTLEAWVKGRKK